MDGLHEDDSPILLSYLAFLELTNAANLGVFRNLLTREEASVFLRTFESNMQAGLFRLVPTSPLVWKVAGQLADAHTAKLGCRSLDILHAANALLVKAELFLTFDQRQLQSRRDSMHPIYLRKLDQNGKGRHPFAGYRPFFSKQSSGAR